jgi:hypothetical protein
MAKGVRLRLLSLRGSWVQIPPPASLSFHLLTCSIYIISCFSENGNGIKEKKKRKNFVWLLLSSSKYFSYLLTKATKWAAAAFFTLCLGLCG